jgi:hypothetical protein
MKYLIYYVPEEDKDWRKDPKMEDKISWYEDILNDYRKHEKVSSI